MWEYTDKVKEHFFNPRNMGDLDNANAVGEVGSIACGDALKLMLIVDPKTERIIDARFKTFGCGSAIASSSMLTEMIKGKTIEEALSITNEDIAEELGGLPPEKMHCSVMGRDALEAAVANYRGEHYLPHEDIEDRLVCHCFGVTEGKIRRVALENNLHTVEEITNYTKAGGGCGSCIPEIEHILSELWSEKMAEQVENQPIGAQEERKLTNVQRLHLIEETINNEIRPYLRMDGGDIQLVDVDGKKIYINLIGMCAGCMHAQATLKGFVQHKLRELVEPDLVVEEHA